LAAHYTRLVAEDEHEIRHRIGLSASADPIFDLAVLTFAEGAPADAKPLVVADAPSKPGEPILKEKTNTSS